MGAWAGLSRQFDWRPSQRHLLQLCDHVSDEIWHLCAPPGAGKTLIGLELARRLDRPTLVLSPTVAIRDQWRRSVALFGADPAEFATDDVTVDAPLLSITYHLIGNPGEATAEVKAAARRLWVAELAVEHGQEGAEQRIAALESQDPGRAAKDLRRHVRMLRRALGSADGIGVPVEDLLGQRAHDLVDQLAARGIGCVILDECHHLLDWWALVVTALVERIEPAVIGLTATLPDPDGAREAENYERILGEVDAELHLAALVAEGSLAPWRDAVRLTELTPEERSFLDDWGGRFAQDLDEILAAESFLDWAVRSLGEPALDARGHPPAPEGWDAFWDRDPLAAMALGRWWRARGMALPAGFRPPWIADLEQPLGLDDRLVLLDAWLHDVDSTAGPEDRDAVATVTNRHGVSITSSGIRWGRSVADVVCARSAAKADAAAWVVADELSRRGAAARALVVVERDRAGTPPAEARAVLGEEAGTVATMLARLCAEPTVVTAGVVAVTGSGAWCDAVHAQEIAVAASQRGTTVSSQGCGIAGAMALVVDGATWRPADWLEAAESAMDAGVVHTLVATRGLVGEGWDHAPIDVLVDCSEVASRTAATQLRGRALRVDPARPAKVATLWDVTVVHPGAPGDWERLRRRHRHWWGPDPDGVVRTGAEKIHARLGRPQPPGPGELAVVNAAAARCAADLDATRRAWSGLDPAGVATAVVSVRSRRSARRRVRVRRADWTSWTAGALGGAGIAAGAGAAAVLLTPALWAVAGVAGVGAAAAASQALGRRRDEADTLAALGDAVAAGLAAAGVDGLAEAEVVARFEDDAVTVVVTGVEDDAAAAWSAGFAEAIGPLGTPRWLVAAGGEAWRVPGAVGATRAAADAFTRELRRRVPGARLHRAGTPEATIHVLRAAQRRPDDVTRSLRWR